MKTLAAAALACVALVAPSYSQQATTKDQIIGSWKVLSLKATNERQSHPSIGRARGRLCDDHCGSDLAAVRRRNAESAGVGVGGAD
jgi:hypothetical protein